MPLDVAGGTHDCASHIAQREERAWNNGFAYAKREAQSAKQLTESELEDLIQLCHPDRHPPERRALANRMTAHLLGLRREARV